MSVQNICFKYASKHFYSRINNKIDLIKAGWLRKIEKFISWDGTGRLLWTKEWSSFLCFPSSLLLHLELLRFAVHTTLFIRIKFVRILRFRIAEI